MLEDINLGAWPFIMLALYFIVMFGAGWYGNKKTTGFASFVAARASYGPTFIALAAVSTAASGLTFMGNPGYAYTYGYSGMWYALVWPGIVSLGFCLTSYQVLRSVRRLGVVSLPDYVGARFKSDSIRVAGTVLGMISVITWAFGQIVACGWLFNTFFGIPYFWGTVICCVGVAIYVVYGGTHAYLLTDMLQAIIMIAMGLSVLIFCYLTLFPGGVPELNAKLVEQSALLGPDMFKTDGLGTVFFSTWAIVSVVIAHISTSISPAHAKPLLSLKKPQLIRKYIILYFLFATCMTFAVFGGLGARAYFGATLEAADKALPALIVHAMSAPLGSFFGIALLAAIMSSIAGAIMVISTNVSNEIYRRTIVPRTKVAKNLPKEAMDKRCVLITRIAIIFVLGLGILFSNPAPKFLIQMAFVGSIAGGTAPSVVLGTFWRRVTRAGFWAGIVAGAAGFIFSVSTIGKGVAFSGPAMCFVWATVAVVVVSLLTKQTIPEDHLDKLFLSEDVYREKYPQAKDYVADDD